MREKTKTTTKGTKALFTSLYLQFPSSFSDSFWKLLSISKTFPVKLSCPLWLKKHN